MPSEISNGYFLIARKLFESPVWREDPHILKLFIYLIGEAQHSKKPKRYPHCLLKHGELVTSLSDIAESNEYLKRGRITKWSRQKVSRMLNYLEKQDYISILADTYGTHISVCNYDYYQDCNNYKADRSDTEVERKCYGSVTDVGINNNDKNDKNVKKDLSTSCSEPEKPPDSKPEEIPILKILLIKRDGEFSVFQEDVDLWQETFPGIDVLQQLRKIKLWNFNTPAKRKTKAGIRRHISSWMEREQNKVGKTSNTNSKPQKDYFPY